MPYEILKGARPPRRVIRQHYIMTRSMVEQKVPVVASLPHIEERIPGLPAGVPTLPNSVWGYMKYPYDIAMTVKGLITGDPEAGELRTTTAGYSGKPGAGYGGYSPRVLTK